MGRNDLTSGWLQGGVSAAVGGRVGVWTGASLPMAGEDATHFDGGVSGVALCVCVVMVVDGDSRDGGLWLGGCAVLSHLYRVD